MRLATLSMKVCTKFGWPMMTISIIMHVYDFQLGAVNCFKEKAEAGAEERTSDETMEGQLTLEGRVSQASPKSLDEGSESLADFIKDSTVGYYAVSSATFSSGDVIGIVWPGLNGFVA